MFLLLLHLFSPTDFEAWGGFNEEVAFQPLENIPE